jgi:3-oxoacyl-[acyl-carrier-protein] synthase-3
MTTRIALIGHAYSLPPHIRTNDDPMFDWLREHAPPMSDLFAGYQERRILGPKQCVEDLMADAARKAVKNAGLAMADVDAVIGASSASHFTAPDELYTVHAALGMRQDAWVMPVLGEFANFQNGLLLADSLIRAGRIRNAVVVCGSDWSRHVDYHDAVAISVGDGAGAVVLARTADPRSFEFVDASTETRSEWYGCMVLSPRLVGHAPKDMQPVDPAKIDEENTMPVGTTEEGAALFTLPMFHMFPAAEQVFKQWGTTAPPALGKALLDKHGVQAADVCLMGHQASTVLLDAWDKALRPGQYLNTIATFGNATLASVPLTLAYLFDQIDRDWLLLVGLGLGIHTTAVLLRRGEAIETDG